MNGVVVLKRAALLVCARLLSSSTLLMAQAGSLDPTFGTGGLVTTTLGGENNTIANATAIQSDGKILVAGSIPDSQGFGEPGVARYNTDGSLDYSFGTGGIVVTAQGGAIGRACYYGAQRPRTARSCAPPRFQLLTSNPV